MNATLESYIKDPNLLARLLKEEYEDERFGPSKMKISEYLKLTDDEYKTFNKKKKLPSDFVSRHYVLD